MKASYKTFRFIAAAAALVVFGGQEAAAKCQPINNTTNHLDQTVGCNCNGKDADYVLSNGRYVLTTFPNSNVCKYSGLRNRFVNGGEKLCSGYVLSNFDPNSMEPEANDVPRGNGCWRWKCKNGLAFANVGGTIDYTKCVKPAAGQEIDLAGVAVAPCDEAPITVKLNGVDKRVPGNSRLNGVCVPTCQNAAAANSITNGDDPTEFRIILQY